MSSPDPSHDSFASDLYDQWDPYNNPSQRQAQTNKLKLCQLPDWDSERTYDESYIRYSIVWKVTVNNRAIIKPDTEQDVVLAPAPYWQLFLHPKLKHLLQTRNRSLRSEDTSVVVSVTERKEQDLTKRFDDTSIDWAVIESQLVAWGKLYRAGKKLRLNLSFNYVDTTNTSLRKGDKRGSLSTTQQMLTKGVAQLDAEQQSSGQPSIWQAVYNLMRCTSPPCDKGPHCWRDPVGKKHYKLYTHHLTSLVTHDIRQQLYNEEKKSLDRHKKPTTTSVASFPPINITNVMPTQYQTPLGSSPAGTPALDMPSISAPIRRLNIPGLLDEAVEDYCAWQQSRVKQPALKVEYKNACKVIIDDGMDLELIYQDPNPEFLTKSGIKRGIAQHIVYDIDEWVETCKRARTKE